MGIGVGVGMAVRVRVAGVVASILVVGSGTVFAAGFSPSALSSTGNAISATMIRTTNKLKSPPQPMPVHLITFLKPPVCVG